MSTTEWEQQAGMTGDIDSDNVQDLVEQAETSEDNAAASATAAASSATSASTSANAASNSASSASTSAATATTKASEASTSATNAATSATAAQTAQTAAETAETNAETAQTAAEAAETAAEAAKNAALGAQIDAETAETNAAASATSAAGSATTATTQASNASTSATAAAASATAASASETAASASETAAAASETAAAASESAAAASESAAAASESAASTSETNAANSASSASTSASQAATSATSAAASAASAAATYDAFDDRYLGAKSSDPTLDNDGNALIAGALYFNTTASEMRTYDGSLWIAASSASIETMDKFKYTATASQTAFTGLDDAGNTMALTVGAEIVTLNGVVLEQGTDYTATSDTITLTSGAAASDEVNIYAFGNFTVADTVSKSSGGTFDSVVNFTNGLTTSANITFGDNVKAIFGAGSDLEIYHSGTDTFIRENGTGNLNIGGSHLVLEDSAGANYIDCVSGGAVYIRHNNIIKLETTSTGIDVTGTVTADGLTVDMTSGYARIQDLNSAVVDGTDMGGIEWRTADSSVSGANRITATINVEGDGTFNATDKAPSRLVFSTHDTSGVSPIERMRIGSGGDISFYEDTGTTAKFFWDASAESLGIGTSSPAFNVDIVGNSAVLRVVESGGSDLRLSVTGSASYVGTYVADPLVFATNSTERMRIDSSGNVTIKSSTQTGTTSSLYVKQTTDTGFKGVTVVSADSAEYCGSFSIVSGGILNIAQSYLVGGGSYQPISFSTSGTERMRIDSSGNVGIGTSSPSSSTTHIAFRRSTFDRTQVVLGHSDTNNRTLVNFFGNGSQAGAINVSPTTTTYGTSSDYRLKTDVQPMTGATERLKALKPVNFEWIADGSRTDGFLAHEAQEVVPEAVTGTKDAVDDEGNPEYQGIDQSKIVPLLVASLQEALTEIDSLKARLDTLENN